MVNYRYGSGAARRLRGEADVGHAAFFFDPETIFAGRMTMLGDVSLEESYPNLFGRFAMEPVKVSPTKILRAWGPSVLICGTLLVLLLGPVIELWVRGEPDRSLISGTVAVVLSGLMLSLNGYWLIQIVAHRGYGLESEGENLMFFGGGLGRFLKVPWADITDVNIIRVGLGERIVLKTRNGRQHTILSNVLTGQTSDIAHKIRSAVLTGS